VSRASIWATLSGRQFEVKDVEVLGDALRAHRLGDGGPSMLKVPAEHHLCGGLAVRPGDAQDGPVDMTASTADVVSSGGV
jgi:hypothetical protein